MKVLYFSSTGNCLYVAKRLGGERYSIPQLIKENRYTLEDDVIGIVFPVYGLCIPPYVEEYLNKASFSCDYLFAIATYGFFPGAVCNELSKLSLGNGRKFDYINKIKMAENCITFADMKKQKGDSVKQQDAIKTCIDDIGKRKKFIRPDSFFKKMMTSNHKKNFEYPIGTGITKDLTVNDACVGCGMCARLCPTANIKIENGRPVFGDKCLSCGACIQNCPQNALHHNKEKSGARYRNPNVSVEELMLE